MMKTTIEYFMVLAEVALEAGIRVVEALETQTEDVGQDHSTATVAHLVLD